MNPKLRLQTIHHHHLQHTNQPIRDRVSGNATNDFYFLFLSYITTANFTLHLHHLQHANQLIRGRVSGSATNERSGPQMNPILQQQTLSFVYITCSTPINQSGAVASQATRPIRDLARK
jgi:hypothetical protein